MATKRATHMFCLYMGMVKIYSVLSTQSSISRLKVCMWVLLVKINK